LTCAAIAAICAGCGDDGSTDSPSKPRASERTCQQTANVRAKAAESREVYLGLRRKALRLDPREVGLRPTASLPRVFGVMMETGYPVGCATLVALADGTASIYLSSGGGFIGGGERPRIAAASKELVTEAEHQLDRIPPSRSETLPRVGRVVIRVLTYRGTHAVEASEKDLGSGRHELSGLFYAGQDVITEIREVEEGKR